MLLAATIEPYTELTWPRLQTRPKSRRPNSKARDTTRSRRSSPGGICAIDRVSDGRPVVDVSVVGIRARVVCLTIGVGAGGRPAIGVIVRIPATGGAVRAVRIAAACLMIVVAGIGVPGRAAAATPYGLEPLVPW